MSDQFVAFFQRFLDSYFRLRDLQAVLPLFDPDLRGFGTGSDEKALAIGDFVRLFQRDMADAPKPIQYTILALVCTHHGTDTAVINCELDLETQILEQKVKFHQLRLTAAIVDTPAGMRICAYHISFPSAVHEENEAYPLKELEELSVLIQRLVAEKTQTLREAYSELERVVLTDKLTALYNRNRLDAVLETEFLRFKRYQRPLSLIFIDIDFFKQINDNYGHLAGDAVLIRLAQDIGKVIRNTDLAGRWGGEEFLVILPETGQREALAIAERLRIIIAAKQPDELPNCTISAGITEALPGDSLVCLLTRVDQALYRAKNSGRNRSCLA